jgi:hypothetical protein
MTGALADAGISSINVSVIRTVALVHPAAIGQPGVVARVVGTIAVKAPFYMPIAIATATIVVL